MSSKESAQEQRSYFAPTRNLNGEIVFKATQNVLSVGGRSSAQHDIIIPTKTKEIPYRSKGEDDSEKSNVSRTSDSSSDDSDSSSLARSDSYRFLEQEPLCTFRTIGSDKSRKEHGKQSNFKAWRLPSENRPERQYTFYSLEGPVRADISGSSYSERKESVLSEELGSVSLRDRDEAEIQIFNHEQQQIQKKSV